MLNNLNIDSVMSIVKHIILRKNIFYTVLIVLLSVIVITSCRTPGQSLQHRYDVAMEKNKPFDVIIVPGIPYEGGWDSIMKARVIWSYILYKNGITKNIIYSGSAVYSPFVEAKIMGLYAQKLGIPKEHIFYDTLAEHSTENVFYSYKVAKQHGFKSIALATDPLQALLLRNYTKKRFGTPIYHIPFIMDSIKVYNHINPTIDPLPAYVREFSSITKDESVFKRFSGTLGKRIDWKLYENGMLDPL